MKHILHVIFVSKKIVTFQDATHCNSSMFSYDSEADATTQQFIFNYKNLTISATIISFYISE